MTGPFAGAPPQVGRATARTSVFAEQKPWRRHGFAVSSILIAQGVPSGLFANRWGQGPGMPVGLSVPRWIVSGWPRPSPRGNFCFWVSDFAAWGRAFSNRPQSRAASYFAHGGSSSQSPLSSVSAWRRKLRPLPCSSSSWRTRYAGLRREKRGFQQNAPGVRSGRALRAHIRSPRTPFTGSQLGDLVCQRKGAGAQLIGFRSITAAAKAPVIFGCVSS